MQQRIVAPILLLLTALLWSLGGVLIKSIDLQPMAIAAGRSAIAIPVLLACGGRQRFTFSPAQIGGAIGYAATVALFVFATRMTTAANAIFLQYTAPIYVAIIGRWYLGERALPIDWWVIAVALGGIALFFFDQLTTSGFWGNIVALASGLAFASVVILPRLVFVPDESMKVKRTDSNAPNPDPVATTPDPGNPDVGLSVWRGKG